MSDSIENYLNQVIGFRLIVLSFKWPKIWSTSHLAAAHKLQSAQI
jgi:hypothetical protein